MVVINHNTCLDLHREVSKLRVEVFAPVISAELLSDQVSNEHAVGNQCAARLRHKVTLD